MNRAVRDGDIPEYARVRPGFVDLRIIFFDDVAPEAVTAALNHDTKTVIAERPEQHLLVVRVAETELPAIARYPFVRYVEPIAPPAVPDDTKGRSLHRSNAINVEQVFGRHYSGDTVTISLADDGEVGPHIDFKGRMVSLLTGAGGNHGDMTAGIAGGAGNLDPTIRGMAEGAELVIHDINAGPDGYDHIYNAPAFFTQYGAVVTSTSYSQGCNDYNTLSQTIDQLAVDNRQMTFVFSGGNRGTGDCGYGAGSGWGNITGGMKIGKNVIACANLDPLGNVDATSSRGPADDGRIKPDISANGTDQMSTDEANTYQVGGGTSAACPGIAGVSAQLYQAYRSSFFGTNPEGALIKAVLLNSADDIGNVGPDFTHGFGRVNALRSAQCIEYGRLLSDSVAQGDTVLHTLNVPAGIRQVKVLVHWTDAPGDPAAAFQLVDDLDMRITTPSSASALPWILDPTPNATNLSALATTGADHLNNVEQITLDQPASGVYTVRIIGTSVPSGYRRYYLVWEFIDDAVTLTYPYGGEGFVPGESEWLRWDAAIGTAGFDLSYSADAGVTWNPIASVAADARQYAWIVPAISSDQVLVKVQRGAVSDATDGFITVLPQPSNIQVDYSCLDTLQLSWDPATGISTYDVYRLGAKYMEKIATVSATSVQLPIPFNTEEWFSVGSVGASGGSGRRINAVQKSPGLVNCTYAVDLSLPNSVSPASGLLQACNNLIAVPLTVDIQNTGINSVSGATVSYSVNGGPSLQDPLPGFISQGVTVSHTFSVPLNLSISGTYSVAVIITVPGDLNPANDTLTVSYTVIASSAAVPLTEDFQAAAFPPPGWSIRTSGGGYQWSLRTGLVGSSGTTTSAAWFDDYSYNNPGAEDDLIMPAVDLQGVANPILTFDVAFAVYPGYDDGLKVLVSTDCGSTYLPTGYEKIGPALATVPSSASDWFPTQAAHWRNDTVDLAAWAGQFVILKFVNINDYGNNILVDNVQLGSNPTSAIADPDYAQRIRVYPNPSTGLFTVTTGQGIQGRLIMEITDVSGRLLIRQPAVAEEGPIKIDLSSRPSGIYTGRMVTEDGQVRRFRLVRQ
jgi:hypothetical protein